MADGESAEEALADLRNAFDAWIATAKDLGRDIPKPGAVKPISALVRFPRSLHGELTAAAGTEGVSFNQFVTCALAAYMGGRKAGAMIRGAESKRRFTDHLSVETVESVKLLDVPVRTGAVSSVATRGTVVAKSINPVANIH